jgi:RNA polymerase sigma factor (sigma-70 family)
VTVGKSEPHGFGALIDRARAGDRSACNALVATHLAAVRRRVHHALNKDACRRHPWIRGLFSTGDLVQDVLHGAVRDLGRASFPCERAFVAYLAKLVRNRLVDMIRGHTSAAHDERNVRRVGSQTDVFGGSGAASPGDQAANAEQTARAQDMIAKLPVRDRTLVRMRLLDGAQFQEIAATMGYASAATARLAFLSAHARLLARLRAAGVRGPSDGATR